MTRLAFDIYGPTYPVSTTRLTRVTDYGPGTTFRPRRPMGSGLIVVAKGQDFVTATNFAIGNYVIVRDLDISEVSDSLNVLGGFYLEEGDFSLVTDRTKWLKFGGRSTISVLQRAIMGNESLSPFEGPSSIVDGYWRWGSDTYGGVMRRALFEANLQDPPGLPQIDTAWIGSDNIFWNDDDDSNGDPWPSFLGEFRTQCGTSLLDLYGELYGFGVELEIDARTFDVYAYNTDGYGTDRTGAFGAGNVRFETGVNIVSKIGGVALTRSIHGTVRTTHLLVRTTDHPEGAFIESDDYTPGDPVYKRVYQSGDISGDPATSAALEARAQRNMDLRALAEDAVRFLMRPGDDEAEGLYVAGPNYAPGPTALDAHVWTGDLITLESGSDTLDYNEATKRVEGFDYELVDGGWLVWILTGARFLAAGNLLSGTAGATLPIPLCTALTPGTELITRFYYSQSDAGLTVAQDTSWNDDDPTVTLNNLTLVPDGTFGAGSAITWSGVDEVAGNYVGNLAAWGYQIDDPDFLEAIQNGGAMWVGYTAVRSRTGIGVDDSAQYNWPQGVLRIYRSGTGFIGTALAHYTGDGIRYPQSPTAMPRKFGGVALSAVASAALNDWIIWEPGHRHDTPTSGATGASFYPVSDSDEDLPAIEESPGDNTKNSWIELQYISSPSGSGLHPDLVGDDTSAARCDHKHHVLSTRDPTTADDITQGYPTTTLWTNTETHQTFLLIDEDAGTWILIGTAGEHTHESEDITDLGSFLTTTLGEQHDLLVIDDADTTQDLDLVDANVFDVTLIDDTAFTFSSVTSGVGVRWWLIGRWAGFTPSFPAAVHWPNDTEPTWSTDPDEVDVIEFLSDDGGVTIFGDAGGASTGGAGATDLDDLTDVTITSPANEQSLIYDSTSSQWINTSAIWRPLMDGAGAVITDGATGEAIMALS